MQDDSDSQSGSGDDGVAVPIALGGMLSLSATLASQGLNRMHTATTARGNCTCILCGCSSTDAPRRVCYFNLLLCMLLTADW